MARKQIVAVYTVATSGAPLRQCAVDFLRRPSIACDIARGASLINTDADRTAYYSPLRSATVFLDCFPFTGVNHIIDSQAVQVPCVVRCLPQGYSRNRIGRTIRRACRQNGLVAAMPEAYAA